MIFSNSPITCYLILIIVSACFGSFLNVVIYRLPQAINHNKSQLRAIVSPGYSSCPKCKTRLKWYHNIPIVSWLGLRGKCAFCQAKISWHYPAVELLTILVSIVVILHFSTWGQAIPALLFSWILIALLFIDVQCQLLPDSLTLGLLWLGLLVNAFHLFTNPTEAILGAVVAYVLFWALNIFYLKFRGKDGLGLGDAKLFAALLAWLGIQMLPYLLLASSLSALIVCCVLLLFKKRQYNQAFAFGPYLAIFGWILMLWLHR